MYKYRVLCFNKSVFNWTFCQLLMEKTYCMKLLKLFYSFHSFYSFSHIHYSHLYSYFTYTVLVFFGQNIGKCQKVLSGIMNAWWRALMILFLTLIYIYCAFWYYLIRAQYHFVYQKITWKIIRIPKLWLSVKDLTRERINSKNVSPIFVDFCWAHVSFSIIKSLWWRHNIQSNDIQRNKKEEDIQRKWQTAKLHLMLLWWVSRFLLLCHGSMLCPSFTNVRNKLECLSPTDLFSLDYCLWVRPQANRKVEYSIAWLWISLG